MPSIEATSNSFYISVPLHLEGNVGIGTTTPFSALHVIGDISLEGSIIPTTCNVYDLGSSNYRFRDLYLSGSTIDIEGTKISKDSTTGGIFFSNNSNELIDTRLRNIFAQGNIGIGISSPNYPLHVNGPLKNYTYDSYTSITYQDYTSWDAYNNKQNLPIANNDNDDGWALLPDFGFDFYIGQQNYRATSYANANAYISFGQSSFSYNFLNDRGFKALHVGSSDNMIYNISYYAGSYNGKSALYVFYDGYDRDTSSRINQWCVVFQSNNTIDIFMKNIHNDNISYFGIGLGNGSWYMQLPYNNTAPSPAIVNTAYRISLILNPLGTAVYINGYSDMRGSIDVRGNIGVGGNIGIGTTTPLAKTHIHHSGSGDIVRVDDEIADTSVFLINQDGNIGIGTITPHAKAHVHYSGSGDIFRVNNHLSINENGNVGIGTGVANVKLFIAGDTNIGGNFNRYPPLPLTSNTTVISGAPYGNGTYITSESEFLTNQAPLILYKSYYLFDNGTTPYISGESYDPITGNYTGATSTSFYDFANNPVSLTGVWIQIQLPSAIKLHSYRLYPLGTGGGMESTPKHFVLLGSVDGVTWNLVDDRRSVLMPNVNINEIVIETPNIVTAYNYYRMVVNVTYIDFGTRYVRLKELGLFELPNRNLNVHGNIGIGTDNPTKQLTVSGTIRNINGPSPTSGTSLVITGSGDIAPQSSDARYKTNVEDLSPVLDSLMNVRAVSYNWKDEPQKWYGLLAQQVAEVFPDAVWHDDGKDTFGVHYTPTVVTLLLKAIQELKILDAQKNQRIQALENKL